MSLERDIHILSRVRMFEGFSHEHLRLIAFGAEARTLSEGTRLYRADAYSDGGYVIVSGKVELQKSDDGGTITEHGPGALLGELALIAEINHAATAMTVEKSEVLKIPRPLFRRILEEYPELAEGLHAKLSKSVNDFVAKLETVRVKLDRAEQLSAQK